MSVAQHDAGVWHEEAAFPVQFEPYDDPTASTIAVIMAAVQVVSIVALRQRQAAS